MDRIATSWEKPFATAARKALEHDKREVLALVGKAKQLAKARKASVDYETLTYDLDEYLRTNGNEYWRELFVPLLSGVVTDQGREWASTIGTEFDVRNLEGEYWFSDYTLNFAQPINYTTEEGLHNVISQGLTEGWPVQTLQNHISQMFDQWANGDGTAEDFDWYNERMPAYRTEMIARTETMRASNVGGYELMREWGVGWKGWLGTIDGRERTSHRIATQTYDEGGTVGVIAFSAVFTVGGYQMRFPGDSFMGAPPSEYINCRCTILPYPEKPTTQPGKPSEIGAPVDYTGPADERLFDETVVDKYIDAGREWASGLEPEEYYACADWCGAGYDLMSKHIRSGTLDERDERFLRAVNSAPNVNDVVYMGERGNRVLRNFGIDTRYLDWGDRQRAAEANAKVREFWDAMVGTTLVIPKAKSASLSAHVAASFAPDAGYILQIKSNRGKWINPANPRYMKPTDEYEVHFPDLTELKIVEVREVDVPMPDAPTHKRKRLIVICDDVTEEK